MFLIGISIIAIGISIFRLSNEVYDILKYSVCVAIPALTTFYVGLAKVVNLPYASEVAQISALVCTLIGSLVHISSSNYWAEVQEQDDDAR